MACDMTAIVLTKNEEKNIANCLTSIKDLVKRIVVVDSGSNDRTVEIAKSFGAEVFYHEWIHYARQFNWALDNLNIMTKWVYRIDADEIVTPALRDEIERECREHTNDDVNAFIMKFKIFFMGRFLTHGGVYPFYNVTIFKNGFGRYEDRAMGEHIVVSSGRLITLKNDCLHYDFKNLDAWIDKHNKYSTREVKDRYAIQENGDNLSELYDVAEKTKGLRDNLYYKLPKFMRARLYYWYRYYVKLGFLDGKPGKIYAFLQAYWYRFLVDAKLYEQEVIDASIGDD